MREQAPSSDAMPPVDFLVGRDDLRRTRFEDADPLEALELAPGQAVLRVDRFAFTANNVTYAAIGEEIGYWKFFPAPEGWGRIPVWGYGDVARSRAPDLAEGTRVFGYFPMSSHLRVEPQDGGEAGFRDAAAHRAPLPPVYNQYTSTRGNPIYEPEREDHEMILRPLFMTSFLLDDYLADHDFFGAGSIVFSSASSKTAFGTAALLAARGSARPEIVGLTSPGNAAFVEQLGCYDRVRTYDAVGSLARDTPAVFVDFTGNRELTRAVHERLAADLRQSVVVGATHWESRGGGAALPGPKPTLFFAPAQIQKRAGEWGAGAVQQRFAEAWRRLLALSDGAIRIVRERGQEAVERVYREALEGRLKPDVGHVLSL